MEFIDYYKKLRLNIKSLKTEINIYHSMIGILKPNDKYYFNIGGTYNVDDKREQIRRLLNDILPHRSGINCEWTFYFFKNGSILCNNYFHAMNNNGMYVQYIPISIKFYRIKRNIYHKYRKFDKDYYQITECKGTLDYKVYAPNSNYYHPDLGDYIYSLLEDFELITDSKYLDIKEEYFEKPYIIQ